MTEKEGVMPILQGEQSQNAWVLRGGVGRGQTAIACKERRQSWGKGRCKPKGSFYGRAKLEPVY